jgi:tetratricopeptide (TPR) repeat protein
MPRLFAAVECGDQQTVHGVVNAFAQPARTWGEVEFLHDWATAVESGDKPRAAAKLQLASTVGRSLADGNDEYLLLDAAESIRRAVRTGQSTTAARAQRQYRQGRFLYSKRLVAEAGPLFEEARRDYAAIGCPLALMAEYYSASVLYDSDRTAAALEVTESLFQRTPPRYRALRAQLHWLRGTILVNRGQLRAALDDYRTAMAVFDNMRERENASIMRDNVALTLALLGRGDEAWRVRRKAFSEASTSGDPTRVHLALTVASRQSIQEEQWNVVWSLLHLVCGRTPFCGGRLPPFALGRRPRISGRHEPPSPRSRMTICAPRRNPISTWLKAS